MHYLSIFEQSMRYFFARLDEKHKLLGDFHKILKISDKNSIKKNFLASFGKDVGKNRAVRNNTIFLQKFSICRGRGTFRVFPPPLRRLCYNITIGHLLKQYIRVCVWTKMAL